MSIASEIIKFNNELPQGVKLVAVSKFHPVEAVKEAYDAGQRIFGESRPQEFVAKCRELPPDIEWHFIGHLQTNKLKLVLPYASLVQSVDSVHLFDAINAWGTANGKIIDVLLEVHLGAEKTKNGMTEDEILGIVSASDLYKGVRLRGLMGMATNTDNEKVIRDDFNRISVLRQRIVREYPELKEFTELSIGMSDDYNIALEFRPTFVRIGTAIFGARNY